MQAHPSIVFQKHVTSGLTASQLQGNLMLEEIKRLKPRDRMTGGGGGDESGALGQKLWSEFVPIKFICYIFQLQGHEFGRRGL